MRYLVELIAVMSLLEVLMFQVELGVVKENVRRIVRYMIELAVVRSLLGEI